jgi:hypothetical protein
MRPVTERSTLLVRNLLLPTSTSLCVVIREGGGVVRRGLFMSLEAEGEEKYGNYNNNNYSDHTDYTSCYLNNKSNNNRHHEVKQTATLFV